MGCAHDVPLQEEKKKSASHHLRFMLMLMFHSSVFIGRYRCRADSVVHPYSRPGPFCASGFPQLLWTGSPLMLLLATIELHMSIYPVAKKH